MSLVWPYDALAERTDIVRQQRFQQADGRHSPIPLQKEPRLSKGVNKSKIKTPPKSGKSAHRTAQ